MFQNLCMKSCNTIYRVSRDNSHVSHSYLSIHQNCHLTDFFFITRIHTAYLFYKTPVDFLYDLIYTRKQS